MDQYSSNPTPNTPKMHSFQYYSLFINFSIHRPCEGDVYIFASKSLYSVLNNHLNTSDPVRWAGEMEF